ncbi:MAG: hypothetical protein K2O39_08060, partial [Clostridiales bacterium]|nr:hypothetical protein [Clostridiales bacterium]
LPTTVIGMRAPAGSANPADFLFPSLVATVLSTAIGIIGVKICSKIFDRPRRKPRRGKADATDNPSSPLPLFPVSSQPKRHKNRERQSKRKRAKGGAT